MASTPATSITELVVYQTVEVTRRAVYTVAELARITGETVEDIVANVDNGTLDAWAGEYLSDPDHPAGRGIGRALRQNAVGSEGPATYAVYR